jgi:hypothetical protein
MRQPFGFLHGSQHAPPARLAIREAERIVAAAGPSWGDAFHNPDLAVADSRRGRQPTLRASPLVVVLAAAVLVAFVIVIALGILAIPAPGVAAA